MARDERQDDAELLEALTQELPEATAVRGAVQDSVTVPYRAEQLQPGLPESATRPFERPRPAGAADAAIVAAAAAPAGGAVRAGDVIDGKYRVSRVIGQGGMGIVVEAQHLVLDEPVAIKVLRSDVAADEQARTRFEREARTAFKIKSEHVARVIDVGRLESGAPYLVMEYLEGADLGRLLAERGPLPVAEAVGYVLQACEAIGEAHALGIVHRDLKPANLFRIRRPDGTTVIKLLDFGLSKIRPTRPAGPRPRKLTATKQVMGTAGYMSPEQWMSTRDVGPATDIWSVGVILFELLTGENPFDRQQVMEVYRAIMGPGRPRLQDLRADVPVELERVVASCLEKEPARRCGSVAELARALRPFASPAEVTGSAVDGTEAAGGTGGPAAATPSALRRELEVAPTEPALPYVAASPAAPPSPPTTHEAGPAHRVEPSRQGARQAPTAADRLWAQIMTDEALRPRRRRAPWLPWALVLLFVAVLVAAVVWTNRHALDAPRDPPAER